MPYTPVHDEEAAVLLREAGQAELASVRPLAGGWANSNYLLELVDGSRLVLKVWDGRTPQEVASLVSTTHWLARHGVPTPTPLPFEGGGYVRVRDGRAWMLMPYVEVGWLPVDSPSLEALGRAQARLHAVPVCDDAPRGHAMGFALWRGMFVQAEREGSFSPFLRRLQRELEELGAAIPADLPRGLVHGDLFPDNVLGTSGQVHAILDLEELCVDVLALDLAMSFVGFGWEGDSPQPERWRALLSGYESVRPLTAAEKRALPALHRYATLAIAAWRYHHFVMTLEDSPHADRYRLVLGRLECPTPFFGEGAAADPRPRSSADG